MYLLSRTMNVIRPVLNHTKRSLPVLIFLIFVFILIGVWFFGDNLVIFDKKPFASTLSKVLVTVLVLFVTAVIYIFVLVKRNSNLQQENKESKKEIADPLLPFEKDQDENFKSILASLRKNIHSRNYLYKLPWYLVIGSSNTGKTSLINRSSQKFSLSTVERTGKRYQRSKSPYTIDWWIGNDAVLIDPDGELITQNDIKTDKEGAIASRLWNHFIKWLVTTRSRRPLNGIILTIDFPQLAQSTSSNRQAMAGIFRTRIQELIDTLGTRLPVYVVFTKIDLVFGFDSIFKRLNREHKEKIFGFSFSQSASDVDSWINEFEKSFDNFINTLNEIIFDRLAANVSQAEREEMYSFVRQFDGAREIIFQYISDILESDRFSTPAISRGVFFTSLFQHGVQRNLMLSAVSNNYSLPSVIPAAISNRKQTIYFSQHLFQKIIYPEAGLAGDNQKITRRRQFVFGVGSLAAILGSALILAGWQYHFEKNKSTADKVIKLTSDFANKSIPDRIDPTGKNLLPAMNTIRDAALAYGDYRESLPLFEDMGLYQGRKIGKKVDVVYQEILSKKFLPALAVGLIEEMKKENIDSEKSLAALRIYRMLEDKNNRRTKMAEDWMAKMWQRKFPDDGLTQKNLLRHFNYAMKNVAIDLSGFKKFIIGKQYEYKQIPLERRVYRGIQQSAESELYTPLDFRNEIGPDFDSIYFHETERYANEQTQLTNASENAPDRYQISALYTVPGFKDYYIPQMDNVMELALVDAWSLGYRPNLEYSREDKKVLTEKIRNIYISDYVARWRKALNNLKVVNFKNINHASKVLETFVSSSNPLKRLLELVKKHSVAYEPLKAQEIEVSSEILNDPNRKSFTKVSRSFSTLTDLLESKNDTPPYLEELLKALGEVYSYVKSIEDAPDMGKAALQAAKSRLKLEGADPIFALKRVANGLPEPLNVQINQVAENSWKVILLAAVEQMELEWFNNVYVYYSERIKNRYPFDKFSDEDISLNDFEEFFSPKGRLQQFYDKYLKIFIEENSGALQFPDTGSLVREDFLDNLQSAWDIQDSFFDSKGGLNVEFSLKPLGLSGEFRRSILSIDGQIIDYSHGPSYSSKLIWPNSLRDNIETKLSLISIRGESGRIRYGGSWSWFRMLERADLTSASSDSINLRFQAGGGSMIYRLTAEDNNNPFIREPFNKFYLPAKMLSKPNQ